MKRKKSGRTLPPRLWLLFGALIAFAASVGLVALTALLLQKQVIGFETVRFINPGIKVVCAVLAGFLGTRRTEKRGWLFGAVSGIIYIVFTTVVFSLLSGGFALGTGNLADLAMCAFAGMLGGMLRSIVRR